MTKKIPLTQGLYALVDDKDFERVNQYKWYALKHGRTFYAVRHLTLRSAKESRETGLPRQALVRMHRFIMNAPDGVEVDHKDHNGLNNQIINLRFCMHEQNVLNQLPQVGKSSQYRGIYWNKQKGKWVTLIGYNEKRIYLGAFNAEEDAARAYDAKAKELFGEFAYSNLPGEVC